MSDVAAEYAAPIPAAVRRSAARAEQLAREAGMANVPGDDGSQTPAEQLRLSSTESPSITSAGEGGSAPPPAAELGSDAGAPPPEDTWEQRYRVLQGKYDAETAQSRGQVTTLQRQVEQLHGLLAQMQTAPASPPPSPSPPAPPAAPVVTSDDRELYGDDLPAAVGRWSNEATAARFQQLEGRVEQLAAENARLRGGQEQQGQYIARNAFEAQLDADPELGNGVWRQLNRSTPFYNWLQQTEHYSGQTLHVLLQNAADNGDADRAATFFKSYLAAQPALSHQPRPTPHTNGAAAPSAGRPRLEDMAAPGRVAASGTNGGSPEARIWTNGQISAFYRDVLRGVFNGRDAEKARLEADIIAAGREGRVYQQ